MTVRKKRAINYYKISFHDMLSIINEKTIQKRCIPLLIEVSKYLNDLSPELMNKVVDVTQYKLCTRSFAV